MFIFLNYFGLNQMQCIFGNLLFIDNMCEYLSANDTITGSIFSAIGSIGLAANHPN